jgi:parvulin-like peptidyl-prolyl isomerase
VTPIVLLLVVLGAAAPLGCSRDADPSRRPRADDAVVEDAIARVGAHSIGAAEVRSRVVAEGLSAQAALAQLIDEAALLQETERSGFTEDRRDVRSIERLMVRTMLRDLELENTPASIPEEDVRGAYALNASEFEVPEQRGSWHILVESQSEAAEALAESILRELEDADDPRAIFDRYADGGPEGLAFDVKAEDLPLITTRSPFKKAYKDAVFGAKSKGPVKKTVKTPYGWHAIVVTEIIPADVRTLEEAEDELRLRLSQKRRLGAVVAIVQKLEAEGLVQYDEKGVESLLSMPGLPARSE